MLLPLMMSALLAPATCSSDPQSCDLALVCAAARSNLSTIQESSFLQAVSGLPVFHPAVTLGRPPAAPSLTCPQTSPCPAPASPPTVLTLRKRSFRTSLIWALRPPPHRTHPVPNAKQSSLLPGGDPSAPTGGRAGGCRPYSRKSSPPCSSSPPWSPYRPERATSRQVCRTCNRRKTVCTVYSVGTYAGCTGAWLMAGVPGQLACNIATVARLLTPVSLIMSCLSSS